MADESLPLSTGVVLRDRTRTNRRRVFTAAVIDLLNAGIWRHERRRQGLFRRVDVLIADREPLELREPLRYVDSVLREATRQPAVRGEVSEIARWVARHARAAPDEAVKRTIEDLVAAGLLERVPIDGGPNLALRPTTKGDAAIKVLPPDTADDLNVVGDRERRHELASFPGLSQGSLLGAWTTGLMTGTHEAHGAHTHPGHDGGGHAGLDHGHHG